MSKQKELAERIENIRKMQEHQERDVASAEAQASDLDEIMAVSSAEHESSGSSRKLRSASDLHGPGSDSFRAARTGPALNTETAYAQNLAAAHFASPEAFSRKRSKAPPVLGPGAEALPGPRPTPTRAPSGQATGARTGAARGRRLACDTLSPPPSAGRRHGRHHALTGQKIGGIPWTASAA